MDDLTICKRIAEIDLSSSVYSFQERDSKLYYQHYGLVNDWKEYNPIKDGNLLIKLVEKYLLIQENFPSFGMSEFELFLVKRGDFARSALLTIIDKHELRG